MQFPSKRTALSLAALMTACAESGSDPGPVEIGSLPEILRPLANAQEVKAYRTDSGYFVDYWIESTDPHSVLLAVSRRLDSSWRPRLTHSFSAARSSGNSHVAGWSRRGSGLEDPTKAERHWMGEWQDSRGARLMYMLSYDGSRPAPADRDAQATHFRVDLVAWWESPGFARATRWLDGGLRLFYGEHRLDCECVPEADFLVFRTVEVEPRGRADTPVRAGDRDLFVDPEEIALQTEHFCASEARVSQEPSWALGSVHPAQIALSKAGLGAFRRWVRDHPAAELGAFVDERFVGSVKYEHEIGDFVIVPFASLAEANSLSERIASARAFDLETGRVCR